MKCGHDIREDFVHGEFATYARVVSACLVFVGISLLPDPVRASDASESLSADLLLAPASGSESELLVRRTSAAAQPIRRRHGPGPPPWRV